MLPDQPWLVKCQHCNTLVWIDEQKQVGEIDPWGSETRDADKFPDARPASTPTLQDYADFIEAGVSDKEKERYVRHRTWWAGNDPRREKSQSTSLDSFEAQNLRAFVTLLDEDEDNDRIMKAEALRELCEFARFVHSGLLRICLPPSLEMDCCRPFPSSVTSIRSELRPSQK